MSRWFEMAAAFASLAVAACSAFHAPAPLLLDPNASTFRTPAPAVFLARFETSRGTFEIEVHRDWAPIGADRFYNLVRNGFFDGQRFFRIRAGVFAQFGIPGDPAVASAWRHATIPDDPPKHPNERGTIAFAFTTANTRATQLFVNLRDNLDYDQQGFAPLGKVVSGMEVLDALYSGYGEAAGGGMRAGHQDPVFSGGNAYLEREFPRLDWIVRARIVSTP